MVSLAVGYLIVGFVGAIDWATVASSISRLAWWQFIPLTVVLLIRLALNAVPLSQFVTGLSLGKSMQNDLAANLAGTIAPPPGDVVVRVAMFNSWRINPLDGMAGVTLNMLTFYSVRLLAPAVGLILLAIAGAEGGNLLVAFGCAVLSVLIVGALLMLLRGDTWAALLGRSAARVVGRFKATVDPQVWAEAVVDFRGRMTEDLPPRLARSMVALLGMILADATILALALRFTGIGADLIPLLLIYGAFMTAYPLTIMPLFGLGVLDAALLASFTEVAGLEHESTIVAALAIWRVVTLLGTLAMGAVVTAYWKSRGAARRSGRRGDGSTLLTRRSPRGEVSVADGRVATWPS